MNYPLSIQKAIESFAKLPTVGRKTAERFVFYLLKQSQVDLDSFADSIKNLKSKVGRCKSCGILAENDSCEICANPKRNQLAICIVTNTQDLLLIEKTNIFNGLYHILGNNIDPIKGITPEKLNIQNLLNRLQNNKIEEIILALSPTFEGETTALYLQKILKDYNSIRITRLARGLPAGANLEYMDENTLSQALQNRS